MIAAFVGYGIGGKLVMVGYNVFSDPSAANGLPALVDSISYYSGGFCAGTIAILMLINAPFTIRAAAGVLLTILGIQFAYLYHLKPELSFAMLRYEIVIGGGIALGLFYLYRRLKTSQ